MVPALRALHRLLRAHGKRPETKYLHQETNDPEICESGGNFILTAGPPTQTVVHPVCDAVKAFLDEMGSPISRLRKAGYPP